MRLWLLHVGEELPVDGEVRPRRYGYLAQALGEAGHDVLYWAPTFRHLAKRHRFSSDRRVQIAPRYEIQFVHAPGYRRNISLERLRAYRILGQRLRELADREARPDVVVAAIPSLEWANAAVDYGRAHHVPVVIDVRDNWPDTYLNALPAAVRAAGRVLLRRHYRLARRACQRATALTAVSNTYLQWAVGLAGRPCGPRDRVMPLGFDLETAPADSLGDTAATLHERGIGPQRPIALFAGRFERSYDLDTVIEAARRLAAAGRTELQFVLCGDGSRAATLRRRASGLPNVQLPGWVDAPTLRAIASSATIGICAYAKDATQSLPNKPFEYMAHRLAVVSSLDGELAQLVAQHQCGVTYRAGDAESLTKCLTELLDSPQRLATMRSRAHEAWSRHYRSRDVYARFVDHLATLPTPSAAAA